LAKISLDVWLYGTLASYGGEKRETSFANVRIRLPEGSKMSDLLSHLKRDRVALFDLKSMWPFQYRHGAAMTEEMKSAINSLPLSTTK
jgi:hypothetical protein